VEDARDLMYPDQTKWGKIATQVNEASLVRGGHCENDNFEKRKRKRERIGGHVG
jgi:hypothetical protein